MTTISGVEARQIARMAWRERGGDPPLDFFAVIYFHPEGSEDPVVLAVEDVPVDEFLADIMVRAREVSEAFDEPRQFWLVRVRADASIKCCVFSAS